MRTIFCIAWVAGGICNGEGTDIDLARRKLQDAVSSIRRRQTSLFVDIQRKRSDKRK